MIPTQYLLLYSSRTTYKILKQNLTNSDYDWILKKEIKEVIGDYKAIQITNYCLTIIKTRKRFIIENMTDFLKCVEIFYYSLKIRIIPFCWNTRQNDFNLIFWIPVIQGKKRYQIIM